ncbi:MAG TPA: dihydrofolate reductase family protein [Kofleriaceae bacterium]|jgi:dihydrofolate reductase
MRKLILKMSMTVDGFVAGPRGELDWLFRTSDAESKAWTVAAVSNMGLHIMGRKTYRDMAAYWPTSTEPFAAPMNSVPKMIFTRGGEDTSSTATTRAIEDARAHAPAGTTASDDVVRGWTHPRWSRGDLVSEIAALKAEQGKDILAHGGAAFAQSLVEHDLIDEYRLVVHPVVLGAGLPLFTKASSLLDLELLEAKSFPKGVVAHVYRRIRA